MFQEEGSEQLLTALEMLDIWDQEGAIGYDNIETVNILESGIRVKGGLKSDWISLKRV